VPLIRAATRLEFAAGVTAKLSANLGLYAQGGFNSPPASPTTASAGDGVKGDFGLRYTW